MRLFKRMCAQKLNKICMCNINMDNKREGKTQCSNCKCYRIDDDFIGKSGDVVKRCLRCREKDAKYKRKPEVREKRNIAQKEKKPYVAHREKKRKENEESYLEHNANVAKRWRDQNKQHISKWKTNNIKARLGAIKQQALKKGIPWNQNMTDEICQNMMSSPCLYCGYLSLESLNGIDRMNGKKPYVSENCVPCCKNCNFIKKCLDPKTFILRCQHISCRYGGKGSYNSSAWSDAGSVDYNTYLKRATEKSLEFALSMELFNFIKMQNCHYCNKSNTNSHQNGIDRKNNSLGYITSNVVTCCRECNQMKSDMSDADFVNHCIKVSHHFYVNNTQFPDVELCEKSICRRGEMTELIAKQENDYQMVQVQERVIVTKLKDKLEECSSTTTILDEPTVNIDNLPKYCYYVPETNEKGDGFCCGRLHPKHAKDWTTTKSKKVSTQEKYKQLMGYLEDKEYTPIQDVKIQPKETSTKKEITPEEKFELLSDQQLYKVINMKSSGKTTQEVCDYIKTNFNGIYIGRNFISKLWNDEVDVSDSIKQSEAYRIMLENKKQRTLKGKKFSNEELEWLKANNLEKSLNERSKLFEQKFGKTITRAYISKCTIDT